MRRLRRRSSSDTLFPASSTFSNSTSGLPTYTGAAVLPAARATVLPATRSTMLSAAYAGVPVDE